MVMEDASQSTEIAPFYSCLECTRRSWLAARPALSPLHSDLFYDLTLMYAFNVKVLSVAWQPQLLQLRKSRSIKNIQIPA
jgi:hypothetical protein